MDALKPILLVLAGLVVIFLYAGTMVFGVQAVLYVAFVLFVLSVYAMIKWTSKRG